MKRRLDKLTDEALRAEFFEHLKEMEHRGLQKFTKENIETVSMEDSFKSMLIEDQQRAKYDWPIKILNKNLGGYWPGEMYTIGGTTGIGKSLFAAYLALRATLGGANVLYFSTEMKNTEITRRMWQMWQEIGNGDQGTFYDLNINYADNGDKITPELIELIMQRNIERAKEGLEKRYDVIVVDNLHWFMRGGESVSDDIGIVTRSMKELAVRYDCSVILVSHVNRDGAKLPENKTPPMHYLKGSSYIEQDSDAVIMITRGTDPDGTKNNEAIISLEKNRRNGRGFKNYHLYVTKNYGFSENIQ